MNKLYFIAIYPPKSIIEEIRVFKEDLARNYSNSKALKNDAHITLFGIQHNTISISHFPKYSMLSFCTFLCKFFLYNKTLMIKKLGFLFLFALLFSCKTEQQKTIDRNVVIDSTITAFQTKLTQQQIDTVFKKYHSIFS